MNHIVHIITKIFVWNFSNKSKSILICSILCSTVIESFKVAVVLTITPFFRESWDVDWHFCFLFYLLSSSSFTYWYSLDNYLKFLRIHIFLLSWIPFYKTWCIYKNRFLFHFFSLCQIIKIEFLKTLYWPANFFIVHFVISPFSEFLRKSRYIVLR